MQLKTGDKLFGLERRLYCVDTFPYVFVVHSVTPKLAYIQPFDSKDYKPFDMNDYKQSSKYTVYRNLVSHEESRFLANWRGRPHPAFPSSFDYLWLWDEVSKKEYLQSVLNLKIRRYITGLSSQVNSLGLDNLQQGLKTFKMLNQLSETLDGFFKSKDLVFSETELTLLEVQTFNQILEGFDV